MKNVKRVIIRISLVVFTLLVLLFLVMFCTGRIDINLIKLRLYYMCSKPLQEVVISDTVFAKQVTEYSGGNLGNERQVFVAAKLSKALVDEDGNLLMIAYRCIETRAGSDTLISGEGGLLVFEGRYRDPEDFTISGIFPELTLVSTERDMKVINVIAPNSMDWEKEFLIRTEAVNELNRLENEYYGRNQ